MKNALQLLKQADRYQVHDEPVDIPLDGEEVIKAKLISPDLFELQEELEDLKKAAKQEGIQKGWHKLPIDADEWQEELEGFKVSQEYKDLSTLDKKKKLAELEKAMPKNLAEQRAPYKARLRIVRSILPKLLRDRDTGEKLFSTPEDIAGVSEIIGSNPELMSLLSKAYSKLAAKNTSDSEDIEEAKNE